jgi:xylulokinase
MLYDAQKGTWSERICAMLGLSPAMLPELGEAGMVCGSIHKAASEKSGLPEGTPVILGTLDSATETYGAGAAGPGDVVIRIGTAGGIHLIQDRPSPNPLLLSYPFIKSPFWYTQAGTSSAGSAIAWAAGNIDPTGIKSNFDAFSALAAEAEPGADGLLFHPYLLGERTPYWEASLRGTFTGVGFQHGKKHFARAVLEGVAFSLCDALTSLDIELPVSKPIRVVGGGARDQLLMEVLASILQRELLPLEGTDSSYGAALFGQTIMNGDSIGPEAAIKNVRPILPRKEHLSFYAQRFVEYRTYASKLIGLYRKT